MLACLHAAAKLFLFPLICCLFLLIIIKKKRLFLFGSCSFEVLVQKLYKFLTVQIVTFKVYAAAFLYGCNCFLCNVIKLAPLGLCACLSA